MPRRPRDMLDLHHCRFGPIAAAPARRGSTTATTSELRRGSMQLSTGVSIAERPAHVAQRWLGLLFMAIEDDRRRTESGRRYVNAAMGARQQGPSRDACGR
jgi:hypothetical protein